MPISFNEIPNNWRVPLAWLEIDPSRAAPPVSQMPYKVLLLGQKSAAAPAALGVPLRVSSAGQAEKEFGPGSMLAGMARGYFKGNETTETYMVAITPAAGAKATATVTLSGTAASGGNINLYLGGYKVAAYAAPGSTAAEAAGLLVAAAALNPRLPVTVTAAGAALTVTAREAGAYGNGLSVALGYWPGEELPTGLTATFSPASVASGSLTPDYEVAAALTGVTAASGQNDPARPFQSLIIPGMLPPRPGAFTRLAGGAGVPDLTELWAALGDTQYHLIATPWVDTATLAGLKAEMAERWQALKAIPGQIIGAAGGAFNTLGTLGDSHNSLHLTILGTGGPFTVTEQNLLLYDGISTWYADEDGNCRIQRLITTYKTNAWGSEDQSYLDLNTPLTLTYLRYDYKAHMQRIFGRHKLCDDGAQFGPGQALVTPKMIKGETIGWFRRMMNLGLVENFEQFKRELIVERRVGDRCRVDVYLPPDVVNQLRVLAVQVGFRL